MALRYVGEWRENMAKLVGAYETIDHREVNGWTVTLFRNVSHNGMQPHGSYSASVREYATENVLPFYGDTREAVEREVLRIVGMSPIEVAALVADNAALTAENERLRAEVEALRDGETLAKRIDDLNFRLLKETKRADDAVAENERLRAENVCLRMKRSVWIVAAGCVHDDSDGGVEGVFQTREDAMLLIERLLADGKNADELMRSTAPWMKGTWRQEDCDFWSNGRDFIRLKEWAVEKP